MEKGGKRSINNDNRTWTPSAVELRGFDYKLADDRKSLTVTAALTAKVGGTEVPHEVRYVINADGTVEVKADFSREIQPSASGPADDARSRAGAGGVVRARPDGELP